MRRRELPVCEKCNQGINGRYVVVSDGMSGERISGGVAEPLAPVPAGAYHEECLVRALGHRCPSY